MIQAPTSQYPQGIAPQSPQAPVQLPAAPVAQQPAQTVPSAYSYPTSNFYQYPQAQPAQANAVNIQIFNPQAYAGAQGAQASLPPQTPAATVPAQFVPVQAPPQSPVAPAQVPVEAPVPAPVIASETPAAQAPAPVAPAPSAEAPKAATGVDVESFNTKLRSENVEEQASAIEQIAEMTQNDPTSATALLDTKIMEGLLGVVAKDTSKLQGPTPKQLDLRQQVISGKTLSEADAKEANAVTPMEAAERNKQYALYTIAFLQNLLGSEVQKKTGTTLDIKDMPGAEQVVQTVKSDPNPLLRASAIASLSHIAKPEYKPVLTQVFELAKGDADKNVQDAATKALEQLNGSAAAAPAAPVAEAPKAEEKKA